MQGNPEALQQHFFGSPSHKAHGDFIPVGGAKLDHFFDGVQVAQLFGAAQMLAHQPVTLQFHQVLSLPGHQIGSGVPPE